MNSEPPLELLAASHLLPLGVVLGGIVAIPLWARTLAPTRREALARALAVALVVYRIGFVVYQVEIAELPWRDSLPLHLCSILFFVCAYMLWARSYATYEVAYFWALGGTLHALVTPDVPHGFPHSLYIDTMLSHGALILSVLYATFVFTFRPRVRSIFKALAATLLLAALLLPINLVLGTNYMYLMGKPEEATLLDYLGPWPWYIPIGVGVALLSYGLWYLPFALANRRRAQ